MLALALSLILASNDHTPAEVRHLLGKPRSYEVMTCGGGYMEDGTRIPKWKCLLWRYKIDGDAVTVYFDMDSGKATLANVSTSDPDLDDEFLTDSIHEMLHRIRLGLPPIPDEGKSPL